MRGDHADYSGAPNRGCVRARAIFPCCDRDPDFTLSFDRFLWSACLPSSLARDRPNRFPRTLASPDAQEQVPNACTGLSPRRRHWRPLEFLARADVLDVSRSRETSKTSERSAGDKDAGALVPRGLVVCSKGTSERKPVVADASVGCCYTLVTWR